MRAVQGVSWEAGERARVTFTLDTRQFGYCDAHDAFVVEPSPLDVMVGNSSSDIAQTAVVQLTGDVKDISKDRCFGFGVEVEKA